MNELGNTHADKDYKPSGISKEEQLCSACCPYYGKTPDQCGYTERKMQWDCPYFDFIERGYEQAEKDLALTWEDMVLLRTLFDATDANQSMGALTVQPMTREYYEYLLREFNEQRKK